MGRFITGRICSYIQQFYRKVTKTILYISTALLIYRPAQRYRVRVSGFYDASIQAYPAVVYVRLLKNDNIITNLLTAK